jgi:Tol biopolymer transport system component
MPLTSGVKLGPYEILSPLGAGGMGEVYRARDTRLDRIVAIKVLPESVATDADRLQRFEQEARVLSTLNHPNLLAIYDVGTQDGLHYLVSEFLEGQTLRECLGVTPLPHRKTSDYALKIASGLAAAHDKGIVHRDLKPENIFVTNNDHVKILDLGLAKQGSTGLTGESVTLTSPAVTAPGTVMGTVGYMSPEQVRGQTVDSRSDIFAFGAILYEMVAGKRAFKGDSGVETMNAILKEDPPDIGAPQMKVSPGMERIVRHCLEKNPANRFQSVRDLAFALSALSGTDSTSAALSAVPSSRKRMWLGLAIAALALAAVAALAFFLTPRPLPLRRLEFAIPAQGEVSHLALSPDGTMLAFVSPDETSGVGMLNVQRIGSPKAIILAGTEGATYPFWSPDEAYVAFFADSKLKKIAVSGGTPDILATASTARGGSWSPRGIIIYTPDSGGPLWKVNADGSAAAPLTDKVFVSASEASHRWPLFLPDGDHFLFWSGNFTNVTEDPTSGIYITSLAAKKKTLLIPTHSSPGYGNGYLFYVDAKKSLRAVLLDLSKETLSGTPQVIADGVGYQPSTYWGAFSAAENGTLVYNSTIGSMLSVLTWFDRTGKELGRVGEVGILANPTISPDGNRVLVDIDDVKVNNIDIWIEDLKNNSTSRFTFNPAEEATATWSRDGTQIAYRLISDRVNIYVKPAQGLVPPHSIVAEGLQQTDDIFPNSWSLDDKTILATFQAGGGGSHLVVVPTSGGKIVPFLNSNARETNGQISPDGKWAAYASDESGEWEIYVTTFPNAAGKWQVSRGGGTEPRWSGDGKEIFYIGAKGMLMAVAVNVEKTFSTGVPMPLFQMRGRAAISSTDIFTYDVTKDGKRFLVNRYVKPDHISPLTIVLNATAESQK